jgi:hypothetical protein
LEISSFPSWVEYRIRSASGSVPHLAQGIMTSFPSFAQSTEQPWNQQGLENNLVQEVAVTVR